MVLPELCQMFTFLRLKDKIRMFFSFDTSEHTQKLQTTPKKLNKQTRQLMKKFSKIIQLNKNKENTASCDYYDLNDSNKVIVTKQDFAVLL